MITPVAEERAGLQFEAVREGPLVALALDPGKTTGYAIGVLQDDLLALYIDEEEISLHKMCSMLMELISTVSDLHIIYESFEYRNFARTGLDLTPVKLIGVIEMVREQFEPFVKFYSQTAATGKAFWSDDKMKQNHSYKQGKKHGRDATRHLLQWAAFGPGGQWIDMDRITIGQLTEWPKL